jgi:hypothetical protein
MTRVLDEWLLTSRRVAVHLPTATAVVADLHLGYNEARNRRGDALPLVPVAVALAPLQSVVTHLSLRRLVLAGDLFEDGCSAPLVTDLLELLDRLGLELVAVVPGNHDRRIERHRERLPLRQEGFRLDGWHVVHGDGALPQGPVVQGHEHPCVRRGNVAAPCYLVNPRRLVLPAFSADARGVNVLRDPRWQGFGCYVVVGDDVLDVGRLEGPKGKGNRKK